MLFGLDKQETLLLRSQILDWLGLNSDFHTCKAKCLCVPVSSSKKNGHNDSNYLTGFEADYIN